MSDADEINAWPAGVLADLCSLSSASVLPAKSGVPIYVGLEHVDSGAFSLTRWASPQAFKSNAFVFQRGDVLYGKLRPNLDKAVIAPDAGVCSTELLVLRPKPDVPSGFLLAILHTPEFIAYALSSADKQYPRTSWSWISQYPIPRPSSDEQKKIAVVLGKVQEAATLQDDIARVARELKQAALRMLFTRGIRGEPKKQTDIGPVPESWDIVPFSKFVTLQRGADLIKSEFRRGTVPVIGATRIIGYHDTANVHGPGVTVVRSGSSAGKAMFIPTDFWAHNVVLYVRDFLGNDPSFTAHWINLIDLTRFRAGVAVPTLNRNSFENEPVPLPDPAEQREIAGLLATLDAKIAHHEARQTLLRELFRTLLHDLLTARRRVMSPDLSDQPIGAIKIGSSTMPA